MVNRLLALGSLSNQFYAMRHGHSEANAAGIIISAPEWGVAQYGLSAKGADQVAESLTAKHGLDQTTRVVSSDFKRARETAEMVIKALECRYPMIEDNRLRERFFGGYDRGSDLVYPKMWDLDRIDPSHTENDVESANAVMARVTELVVELDGLYCDSTILLVAHGDILQILQTAFARQDASRHREQKHLETAEIRQLNYT